MDTRQLIKRLIDIVVSLALLCLLSPILLVTAIAVAVTSSGPVLYSAARVGLSGEPFVMHKFRTMRTTSTAGSAITSGNDPRVHPVGRIMRKIKLDELPQLWDILRGKMTLVGPRPEDPAIVAAHYTEQYRRTLDVKPGLTSPGSLYYYSHLEELLQHGSAESEYIKTILPLKIAIDLVYVDNQSIGYDMRIIARTLTAIVARVLGQRTLRMPPEYAIAKSKGYIDA